MNNPEQIHASEESVVQTQEHQTAQAAENSSQKDLDVCKQVLAEWQEKYARLGADFENYKKRMIKEQASWMQAARVAIVADLLGIIDNFERAMEHTKIAESADQKSLIEGMRMIHTSFQDFLKKLGIREVPYDVFDPLYHEALVQVDSDKHSSGQIVQVLEKGYMMQDHVVRPAKVSVAK